VDPTVAKVLARRRAQANRNGTSSDPAVHVHVHNLHVHPQVSIPEIKIPPIEIPATKPADVHVHASPPNVNVQAAPPTVNVHPPVAPNREVHFERDKMGRITSANVTDG
jgi:hypothetical protein